jgi:RNA polymerase sigma factor (sigma-70 family)
VDADTAIGGTCDRFPSTQVSLLEATAAGLSSDALERVIAVYWKPVYRFVRLKFGKNNEDAKDLTQGFFTTALQRNLFARFDPSKASFRTYLRMAVERFAANEHASANAQKRGGGVEFESVDEQLPANGSPEEIFEREWQRQLFSLALEDLRTHCQQSGKELHFAIFQAYDLAGEPRPAYKELAARHGIAETAVTNHLAWARRMLREFVNDRLRGTTAGAKELREEMRRVWS